MGGVVWTLDEFVAKSTKRSMHVSNPSTESAGQAAYGRRRNAGLADGYSKNIIPLSDAV